MLGEKYARIMKEIYPYTTYDEQEQRLVLNADAPQSVIDAYNELMDATFSFDGETYTHN